MEEIVINKMSDIVLDLHKSMPYDEVIKIIRPFDLLIFHHHSLLSRIIIEAETLQTNMSICSHVGIVITSEISIPGINMDKPKILESTVPLRSDPHDLETNKYKTGVQIRDLKEVIDSYNKSGGKVAVCRLNHNPLDTNKTLATKSFLEVYNKYKTYKYGNTQNLLGAVFSCFRPVRNVIDDIIPAKQVFCSQFVTIIYLAIGVITDKFISPRDVMPTDFLGNDEDGLIPFVKSPIWIK